MTDKQPHEALRLADALDAWARDYATTDYTCEMAEHFAAELRRLHAANLDCVAHFDALMADYKALTAAAQQALEALTKIAAIENQMYGPDWEEIDEAREIAVKALAALKGQA